MKSNRIAKRLIIVSALLCGVILFCMKEIKQNEHYHHFADERTLCVPNAGNVFTNIAFLIVGIWAFYLYLKQRTVTATFLKVNYITLFSGIIFTAFGSIYYHWNPTGSTLIWDRIPMTVVFASFFSIVVSDVTDETFGVKTFGTFLAIGCISMIIWQLNGDLRLYVFVQFFPALMVVILLFLRKIPSEYMIYFYGILGSYIIAKIFERYDHETYKILQHYISGHSLKHLFAAVTTYFIVKYAIFRMNKLSNQ